jgi:prepilin-type N-terminal cleavage/methylation domain-containing protein
MRRARGFTLIEMTVVIVILGILVMVGYPSLRRVRPRANLAGTAAELSALLSNARQNALATGNFTVVMVFPNTANKAGGTGRVVVYQDPTFAFLSAASTPNFGTWDATKDSQAASSALIGSLNLPRGITFGFGDATAPTLAAPYAVTAAGCNFCSTGAGRRGAIVFDARGRARFYRGNDARVDDVPVGTLALTSYPESSGYRLVLVAPATGSVRAHDAG